jgi:hypothetical protein
LTNSIDLLFLVAALIVGLISISIGIYASIWAFKIRKAIVVQVYRNQALGIGMIALLVVILELVFDVAEIFYPFLAGLSPLYLQMTALVLLYWINASVNAGRRTDPLQRNTLHWEKLRFVILGLSIFEIISSYVIIAYNPGLFKPTNILPAFWLFSPLFETMGAGAVILPIVARRSGDRSLRRHLQWFGRLGVVILMALPIGILTFETNEVVNSLSIPILLIAAAYCLYKSVKSLVPLNKLPLGSNVNIPFGKARAEDRQA